MHLPLPNRAQNTDFYSGRAFPGLSCISNLKKMKIRYKDFTQDVKTDQCFCDDDEARNIKFIFTKIQDLQSPIPFQHLGDVSDAGLYGSKEVSHEMVEIF